MDGQEVLDCTDVDPLTDRPMKQMRGLAGFPVVIPKGLVCPCLEFEESSCDSSLTGTEECCLMVRSSGEQDLAKARSSVCARLPGGERLSENSLRTH